MDGYNLYISKKMVSSHIYIKFSNLSLCYFIIFRTFACSSQHTLLQQPSTTIDCERSDIVPLDILIVGAGVTGLSTFTELKKLNPSSDVKILEATNRLGGRVKKGTIANMTVELGANWLHNEDSPLFKIAQEMDIDTVQTKFLNIAVYNEAGKHIPRRFESRFKRFLSEGKPFSKMLEKANQVWEGISTDFDGSENVMDVLRQMNYKEQSELDAYIRWWMIDYEYTFHDIALLNYYSIEENLPVWDKTESETLVRDERGYESILGQIVVDNDIEDSIVYNAKVTDIVYDGNEELNDVYKVLVTSVNDDLICTRYKAQRVVVTVPVAVLRGGGYAINFQPPLNLTNLPYYPGQFNKVFFKFNTNFWSQETEFIGILREDKYRYVCNHWQNLDVHIPNSKMLFCILSEQGMEKYQRMNLTSDDLLEPLRVVFGASVVNNAFDEVLMARWDLEPAAGNSGYSSFRPGYTMEQNYLFWGGFNSDGDFIKGEGYNSADEWVVHLSGASSCFEYNEQVDGAYYAGIRTARNVLQSLGKEYKNIEPLYECEP